ncbi:MAG: helicase-exonuclease AddAB subunit AddA [Lachnospiraceae bacterium]|nr:helicase-exonuclease AddAB subunit AddA [Lachnospiraceae bacterium]
MKYTKDQQKVIDIRDCNVLVSAAAGSGKTAVLVERILKLILDKEHPVDIDRLLVVTFTNAAAAQMRERISDAILLRLEETPEDENLQRQAILVHHAQITTIDSFCRFILQNHFQEIDLDPGFMVGDPGRMKLMEKEAMEKVMEEAYGQKELYDGFYEDFIRLGDAFSGRGSDKAIEDMIESLYRFSISLPFPNAWLKKALQEYDVSENGAFAEESLTKEIMTDVSIKLKAMKKLYEEMVRLCGEDDGPEGYLSTIQKEQEQFLEALEAIGDYETLKQAIQNIVFDRIPPIRKESCDEEKKEQVKRLRDRVKKRLAACKELYFYAPMEQIMADMRASGSLLKPLIYLTISFMEHFGEEKKKENLIDFSDMEHFALKVLVDEEGNPTDTARLYQDYYAQIMIDEYQDSNQVQELLLSVISRENWEKPNRFMVGDMKQSIYKFRMARPELFMEKYDSYQEEGSSVRIDLKQNFRSRKQVISMVNNIFYPLMGREIGGIDYDEDAALYPGASYPNEDDPNFDTELLLYERPEEKAVLSKDEGEAAMIAGRIKEFMAYGQVTDKETGELRKVSYEDIVILVRSSGTLLESLQEVLKREGIPASVPSRTGYFDAKEVQNMLQLLEVLSNPHQDIPLAGVLKSPLYDFTDEELAEISVTEVSEKENPSLYEKLKVFPSDKAREFLSQLIRYREEAGTRSVHDLLYLVIREHRYLEYVAALPAGSIRLANVEMLLERALEYERLRLHGLFGFLRYMRQMEKYQVDFGEGVEEMGNTVRIMTIHKSKGLEFPICFLAGLSKRFNRRDLNGSLLLHTDLGIGMEYRDYESRIKRKTMKQKLIAQQMKKEELGEELRVLYVAMTRAKEKLIMTGVSEKFEEAVLEAKRLSSGGEKIDGELLMESSSFYKMLLLVFGIYTNVSEKMPSIRLYQEEDLLSENIKTGLNKKAKRQAMSEKLSAYGQDREEEIREKLSAIYPHKRLEGLYTKTSVSELKSAALHEDEQTHVVFETEMEESVVPAFMQKEKRAGGALRGTAYHRLMELLDLKCFLGLTKEEIGRELSKQTERIVKSGRMEKEDLALVSKEKVVAFLADELAHEMMEADLEKKLYREQPFVMSIPASRVNAGFPEEETMLIQGIIDAYYEKQGELYLLDYKTDRVDKKEDLIHRYQTQLCYYKEALEKLTGKKVAGIYIYSYHFSQSIAI